MESRMFIRAAQALIGDINVNAMTGEDDAHIQKEVVRLFGGLQNPTLPSAFKLRDVALRNGIALPPQLLQRLQQGEWQADQPGN